MAALRKQTRRCRESTISWQRATSSEYLHFDFRRILRRGDALLDERVPVMAMRTLPQQLRAAVAAAHADVRIEVEDGVLRQLAVAVDQRRGVMKLAERAPDRLMDAQRVRILHECRKQQIE